MEPAREALKLSHGHQAMMLEHAHQTLTDNRRHRERYRDGMATKAGIAPSQPVEDDMLVLGDIHTTVTNQPQRAPVGMSTAAKLAAVSILALGIPGAAIAWRLPEILGAVQAPVIAPEADPSIDTTLDVGLRGGTVIENTD